MNLFGAASQSLVWAGHTRCMPRMPHALWYSAALLMIAAVACGGGAGTIEVPNVGTAEATSGSEPTQAAPAATETATPTGDSSTVTPVPSVGETSAPPLLSRPMTPGRIAYAGLDGAVYTAGPDGQTPLRLSPSDQATGGSGHFSWPAWSPDGRQVSFTGLLPSGLDSIEITLMRTSSAGDRIPVKIHVDDPLATGIAPGVPHYVDWAPNAETVALVTTSSEGVEVVLRDSDSGSFSQLLARGGPAYVSWAPDSRHLLLHREANLYLVSVDEAGHGGAVEQIPGASIAYKAPQWAPDGRRYVYVAPNGAGQDIVVGELDTVETLSIGPSPPAAAFSWSPDGKNLGVLSGLTPMFDSLSILDVATGQEISRLDREIISFWWSPDSRSIAVASPAGGTTQVQRWTVLDAESGDEREIALLLATSEFLFAQSLFDQFAQTHRIWSPDSKKIVLSGAVLDTDDLPREIADIDPAIWTIDAAGQLPPVMVAAGVVGFWSPF